MPDVLNLAEKLEPFILVSVEYPLSEVLTLLHESGFVYAIVNSNSTKALLDEKQLITYQGSGNIHLNEILPLFQPILVLDYEEGILDTDYVRELATQLRHNQAPGVIVLQNSQLAGILPRDTVVRALPLPDQIDDQQELPFEASKSSHCYICCKCKSRRCPPPGHPIPSCPNNYLHGQMAKACN